MLNATSGFTRATGLRPASLMQRFTVGVATVALMFSAQPLRSEPLQPLWASGKGVPVMRTFFSAYRRTRTDLGMTLLPRFTRPQTTWSNSSIVATKRERRGPTRHRASSGRSGSTGRGFGSRSSTGNSAGGRTSPGSWCTAIPQRWPAGPVPGLARPAGRLLERGD